MLCQSFVLKLRNAITYGFQYPDQIQITTNFKTEK